MGCRKTHVISRGGDCEVWQRHRIIVRHALESYELIRWKELQLVSSCFDIVNGSEDLRRPLLVRRRCIASLPS
jgi:hypothetical protein